MRLKLEIVIGLRLITITITRVINDKLLRKIKQKQINNVENSLLSLSCVANEPASPICTSVVEQMLVNLSLTRAVSFCTGLATGIWTSMYYSYCRVQYEKWNENIPQSVRTTTIKRHSLYFPFLSLSKKKI